MTCETCGGEIEVGDWPFCGGDPSKHQPQANSVIGDEIDVEVRHGLCNPDGSPRRFRSRAELKRAEKNSRYTNHVEHIPPPGTDKSKHTQRWI